jgi:hypothetical protein
MTLCAVVEGRKAAIAELRETGDKLSRNPVPRRHEDREEARPEPLFTQGKRRLRIPNSLGQGTVRAELRLLAALGGMVRMTKPMHEDGDVGSVAEMLGQGWLGRVRNGRNREWNAVAAREVEETVEGRGRCDCIVVAPPEGNRPPGVLRASKRGIERGPRMRAASERQGSSTPLRRS